MFVVIISFPPVKAGKDVEFREWFAQAGKDFASHAGLVRRRLLKPLDGGNYAAMEARWGRR